MQKGWFNTVRLLRESWQQGILWIAATFLLQCLKKNALCIKTGYI